MGDGGSDRQRMMPEWMRILKLRYERMDGYLMNYYSEYLSYPLSGDISIGEGAESFE